MQEKNTKSDYLCQVHNRGLHCTFAFYSPILKPNRDGPREEHAPLPWLQTPSRLHLPLGVLQQLGEEVSRSPCLLGRAARLL